MLWKLFLAFLKIGTVGFGSGPAMLVLIEKEMTTRDLMTGPEFTDAVAVGMGLPGPIATKMSLYCGYTVAGVPGALVSTLAMLIPSSIAILVLAKLMNQFRGAPKLEAILRALRPVVVAIFLFMAFGSSRGIRPGWDAILLGVVALALLLLRVDPVWVILGALIFGLLFY